MRVAFVHDWLVTYRGGEKVLETMLKLFPEAPIYTLFYDSKAMPQSFRSYNIIRPKRLIPFVKYRKLLLPVLPAIVESFALEQYDLIISSSSCVAKGIIPGPNSKHISYIHSPMRYIWDQRHEYSAQFKKFPGARMILSWLSTSLRTWDVMSSTRVDQFVVNSRFVGRRVLRYYGKDSTVIHPPIHVESFPDPVKNPAQKGGYFLVAGAMVPYKRFDVAIDACVKLKKPLVVAGAGPLAKLLQRRASKVIKFVMNPDDKKLTELMRSADALIFPGVEDFGMIAIEAMANGTPVIAYQNGGALDFIKMNQTGLFFAEQTVESLMHCLESFNSHVFQPALLREFAAKFSTENFLTKLRQEISLIIGDKFL